MRITEYFERSEGPLISYEIIPPKRGGTVREILDLVEELMVFEPPFIDVTSHAAQAWYEELEDGTIRRHVKRKRPGTIGVCAAIKNRFGIEAVPHLLCQGFTREETEDALIELNYLGIHNVMALRGDDQGYRKPVRKDRSNNPFAVDLVRQIYDMNAGRYLEQLADATPTEFCVGVAGYPEKHFEAPNISWDILNLKRKIEAGAEYIVTQMFFDNSRYFDFVARCRSVGIDVPIIPGLKILTGRNQLQTLPGNFHVSIPEELAAEAEAAEADRVADVGVEWAVRQCDELLSAGVPSIHFYIMQRGMTVKRVVERLRKMA
ncbi:MAG TPA: methylenetetrahydrofolate reductase [NAD(P)H] [Rhodothermales bacterium]|nr:methylenetetrahydrofolate reductase [NAD(P)H] [Rhodothermales bacterium]